jgi:CubicO group peptidase (beta-lactamase class C family)
MTKATILCLLLGFCSGISFADTAAPGAQDIQTVLNQFEAYAESARKQWGIPGMAIAIVKDDQVIFVKGFGVKRLGGTDPVNPDTVFQIGSTSKAFTSALVAIQVDDGKMNWKDRVIDHDPDFEMYDAWVTREFQIWDLMAQHSGMQPYAGDYMAVLGFPPEYISSKIRFMKPITSFRSEFGYVNNLFLVAGRLIERASGKTWGENLQTRIFDPLGMKSSSSTQAAFVAATNAAAPHKIVNGKVTAFSSTDPNTAWAYTYAPSGGVNSSVMDMAQWARMLLGSGKYNDKQIVKAENLAFVMSPHTILQSYSAGPFAKSPLANRPNYYCEGWVYSEANPYPIIWHNGDNSFNHVAIGLIPDKRTGIVILTNLGGTSLAEALMLKYYELFLATAPSDISAAMYEAYLENQKAARAPFAKRPSPNAPAQPLERYAGKFNNPVYGDLLVESDGQKLWMTIGPRKLKMELIHWNHDSFVVSTPATDAFLGDSGSATFSFAKDGKVSVITWDALNDVNDGRFVVISQ